MTQDVLYLGDTAMDQAAGYLGAVMTARGIGYEYLDSETSLPAAYLDRDWAVMILSDYPANRFACGDLERVACKVHEGMSLLMIGGWDSFTGQAGGYNATALREVLPVVMQETDDRINWYGPCVVERRERHPVVSAVPFIENPPSIAGYNRLQAKPNGQTVLVVRKHHVRWDAECSSFSFNCERVDPLLVCGWYGRGRTAAYAGDVAPHWAGGFVDWGDERQSMQAPGGQEVELGNWYVRFWGDLVRWLLHEI